MDVELVDAGVVAVFLLRIVCLKRVEWDGRWRQEEGRGKRGESERTGRTGSYAFLVAWASMGQAVSRVIGHYVRERGASADLA